MEIEYTKADTQNVDCERVYGIDAVLRNFKGCEHLEITLIRYGAGEKELSELMGRNLVGEPAPEVPEEVLAGATEERALKCLLENFTQDEVDLFLPYLKDRYGDLVEKVIVAPLELPIPLGAGPIADLPITKDSGFICFDQAKNYPLPFKVRAYFDFNLQEELQGE